MPDTESSASRESDVPRRVRVSYFEGENRDIAGFGCGLSQTRTDSVWLKLCSDSHGGCQPWICSGAAGDSASPLLYAPDFRPRNYTGTRSELGHFPVVYGLILYSHAIATAVTHTRSVVGIVFVLRLQSSISTILLVNSALSDSNVACLRTGWENNSQHALA
ncbi:hypothetical protein BDZ89DRAFT_1055413 [Hymenopellis radicata]|nr:hypothetical protein BDZ89DRAFT_1055413 [Hymenopellis radicata]